MTDRLTSTRAAQLVQHLTDGAMSQDAVALLLGVPKRSVARFLSMNAGKWHVEGYGPDKNGRPFVRLLRWGPGQDAPRPGRVLTPAQQMQKSRALKKQREAAKQADDGLWGPL